MEEVSLAGGYLLRELIGSGGLTNVYRAEHGPLGRSVAIKMLHAHLVHDVDIVRRFENEARMARLIQHPHSLSVLDMGRTSEGQPYLVMEYVRGRDLALLMHEEGPLAFHRIIDILVQVLDALREAHSKRIIHRDLKPGNVLVTSMQDGSDFARITDFGLALRLPDAPGPSQSATVRGTPDFMSPEQCRGEALDPRSDLYSVGAMLYLLLTEHLPFQAESPAIVMQMQVSERVRDPREVAQRGIPEELADITNKALAKDPSDRFQSAEELIESLRQADRQESES